MIHRFKDLKVWVNNWLQVALKRIDKYITKEGFSEEQLAQAESKMKL
jgi:hypothetical protein